MTSRYVLRCKSNGKYYRSARAKHLGDYWVDDIQQATVLYSNSVFSRFKDKTLYEKVFVKLVEEQMKEIKGYNIVKVRRNNEYELLAFIDIKNNEVIEKDGYKVIPFYEDEEESDEEKEE